MTKPIIGFIGLGLMGDAMVQCLQGKGYTLNVLANRSRGNVEAAIARGANECTSPREIAETSDIIMFCVDTSASVEERMKGKDGVLEGLSAGKTVIDFGTSLPASTRALGELTAEKGAGYLDAPLGRTPAHALDGLLNIMAAGDQTVFERVKPVLEDLGENVFHLGALGAGHTTKLINNFFGMTIATAMSEAFAMADIAGVDRETLYDVIAAGPLRSGMMDFVKGYAVDGDATQLAFAIRNARKDVGYYATMAENAGVESLIANGPKQAFDIAMEYDKGDAMVSEMTDVFAKLFAKTSDKNG